MFRSCSRLVSQTFSRGYRKLPRLEDLPDAHLVPSVALVGRPNVGKSALFNRLVHRREALVFDTPSDHVTRDYREGLAQLGDLRFRVIDTSGLEPAATPGSLQGRAAALTRGVLRGSHGVVMLLDARQGFVPGDEELLSWLRRNNPRPLVIVANKADTKAGSNNLEQITADLASLGYEPPVGVSATSGDGMADLYQLLQPLVDAGEEQLKQQWQMQRQQRPQQQLLQPSAAAQQQLLLQQQQEEEEEVQRAADEGGRQLGDAGDAAAEEAAVDALVQQHMAATAAATSDDESDADSESSYLAPAPGAAGAAAAAAADDDDVESSSEDEQPGDESSLRDQEDGAQGPLRLAILGLPNAGKSTLMNLLLGFERSLTGPEPGLTRDPTYGWIKHAGLDLQLVDTAGWKKASALTPTQAPTAPANTNSSSNSRSSSKVAAGSSPGTTRSVVSGQASTSAAGEADGKLLGKQLADASLAQARRALSACHVVVLLLDAPRLLTIQQAITRLELQLADLAISQGKALVIALNKSDAVPGGPAAAAELQEQVADLLEDKFLPAGRLPVLLMSAQRGDGTQQLLDVVVEAYSKWNQRVSSHKLRATLAKHSVRFYGTGGTASLLQRIKWAVQLKARPPTFVLLLRGAAPVDESGQRFLSNMLRQTLKLQGVPLRLHLRYNKRYRDAEHTDGKRRVQQMKEQKRKRLLAWQERRRQKKRKHRRG